MVNPPGKQVGRIYRNRKQLPPSLQNYWNKRTCLFAKFNLGVLLTERAWYEVTPEKVAKSIAFHIAKSAPSEKRIIIDLFSGVGGNTIAFALSNRWDRVYAIDIDPEAIRCSKANAKLYGINSNITWIVGDCKHAIAQHPEIDLSNAVIFACPPWGGPEYKQNVIFDLFSMTPYSIRKIYQEFFRPSRCLVMYLPRNSNLEQIADITTDRATQVIYYCQRGFCQALCAYFGNFKKIETPS